MTIDQMKARKQKLGYTYRQLAELAGLPVGTVQKILGGYTLHPRRESLLKLQKVLGGEDVLDRPAGSSGTEKGTGGVTYTAPGQQAADAMGFHESASVYGASPAFTEANEEPVDDRAARGLMPGNYTRQGSYTLEDYYSLPDDQRVELIDGVLYDMGAPTSPHQLIGGSMHAQMYAFRKAGGGSCLPLIAPVDVQLDRDDRTMVQPDVVILCDRSKLIRRCIYGAPEFVCEVLSPSTRKKDMTVKLSKYINAGVKEYWVIDPDKKKITVYDFVQDETMIYGFRDPVPVGVWNGECLIDFSELDELLDEIPDEAPALP